MGKIRYTAQKRHYFSRRTRYGKDNYLQSANVGSRQYYLHHYRSLLFVARGIYQNGIFISSRFESYYGFHRRCGFHWAGETIFLSWNTGVNSAIGRNGRYQGK